MSVFRTLVRYFPEASLGISIAVDSQIFQTDVYAASYPPTGSPRHRKLSGWGGRAVVLLIGIRLGIDVYPIYYDMIKVRGFFTFTCFPLIHFQALYTFPQSIGIAGGPPIVIVLLCWSAS